MGHFSVKKVRFANIISVISVISLHLYPHHHSFGLNLQQGFFTNARGTLGSAAGYQALHVTPPPLHPPIPPIPAIPPIPPIPALPEGSVGQLQTEMDFAQGRGDGDGERKWSSKAILTKMHGLV